ncbi:MAG: hypothetical protein M1823_003649 [Watsoniomyces obsoletus]|nr:MAG: hypothetical protein M1823_003649 [Watsoniomyces obsoletus]
MSNHGSAIAAATAGGEESKTHSPTLGRPRRPLEGRPSPSSAHATSGTAPSPSLQVKLTTPSSQSGGAQRPRTSPTWLSSTFGHASRFIPTAKRDSGLGTSASVTSYGSIVPDDESGGGLSRIARSQDSTTSLPSAVIKRPETRSRRVGTLTSGRLDRETANGVNARISTDIPSATLFREESLSQMAFSKRGSILLGGTRANRGMKGHAQLKGEHEAALLACPVQTEPPRERQLSADEEQLSRQVLSMYEQPNHSNSDRVDGMRSREALVMNRNGNGTDEADRVTPFSPSPRADGDGSRTASQPSIYSDALETPISTTEGTPVINGRYEADDSGALEDWEDLEGGDVDRYGFILTRGRSTRLSSSNPNGNPRTLEPQRPQRVSTLLHLASETPRRSRALRKTASPRTTEFLTPPSRSRQPSERSIGITSSVASDRSGLSWTVAAHPFRSAAHRLHANRNKRFLAEAGDMLTLPPGLAEQTEKGREVMRDPQLKEKESERADKWWKMARVVSRAEDGRGMVFDFDTRDPKLISRTWKGIPDRWRATAWHSFLSSSARKRPDSVSDKEIISRFHILVDQCSADDVQIDLDVPRTINRHVLFRRRYRGGQRLLFRLLHSLSLYFPDTGYVQGMASLAATLLCYYDEETAFVMLVRLWQLRGLERLYQAGFNGLMEALGEFEMEWLSQSSVSAKLDDLGIDATAYGTRWYLTLFNYSIPFPAQLRVWDVFMLLGDESDFENAMKVLTSWIPIKDEELFMRVVKAEWKCRRRRR